jgi:hypothetical protein
MYHRKNNVHGDGAAGKAVGKDQSVLLLIMIEPPVALFLSLRIFRNPVLKDDRRILYEPLSVAGDAMATTEYLFLSRAETTEAAEQRETSCSPDFPP